MTERERAHGASPLVSIGIPVFNRAHVLRQALDSLLAQDYPNLEFIISDNASTDDTPEICREYARRDARIMFHRSERNRGAVWNFNRVFELAHGDYFLWCASDDVRLPGYVSRCVAALERRPRAVLCHSYVAIIDEHNHVVRTIANRSLVAEGESVRARFRRPLGPAPWQVVSYGVFRRRAAEQTRLIQNYYGCDIGFVTELALRGEIIQVPEVLFHYRLNSTAQSLPEYIPRLLATLDPRNRYHRLKPLRLFLGIEQAKNVLNAPVPAASKAVLLFDLIRYFTWNPDTLVELHRLVSAALGPKHAKRLEDCVRPVWHRLRGPRWSEW